MGITYERIEQGNKMNTIYLANHLRCSTQAQRIRVLTKLDISMQYDTLSLLEKIKKLCTIVTPFGSYCYNRVPMSLQISPWYAQARMEEVLRGIDEIDVYIDAVEVFTDTW